MMDELNEPDEIPKPESIEEENASLHDQLEAELVEAKNKYQLAIADMENMRKRLINEQKEVAQFAKERVILEFLNPLDCLEKALSYESHMSEETKQWSIGFKMILDQFKNALSEVNVFGFEPKGIHFNPHEHDAVETIETDEYSPGTIVEVLIKGYKMGSKILRPAKVKVAKEKSQEDIGVK